MSAEGVAQQMPHSITLDDLAAMADRDEFHRYELTPEGVLHVRPPNDVEHSEIVMRMVFWLFEHGYAPEQVLLNVGVQTGRTPPYGGRQPDLTVWTAEERLRGVSRSYLLPAGALLFVEVVSPSSRLIDPEKHDEYAEAGVPQYWRVERDGAAPTVHRFRLGPDGQYVPYRDSVQPLSRLLTTTPNLKQLEAVLDEQLPRYGDAIRRLGEGGG